MNGLQAFAPRFGILAPWLRQEQKAAAEEQAYAVVARRQKQAAQMVLRAKLPRVDYVRPNGNLQNVVEALAKRELNFETPDGQLLKVTGRDILNRLMTDESVKTAELDRLENLEDMTTAEYERLGRSNQYIHETILPDLGGVNGNKGVLYGFLTEAQRAGVLYLLSDRNPNRVGKSYYGVPAEVRALLNVHQAAGPSPQCLETPQALFVKALQEFLGQDNVKKQPDAELFEFIANFARAASSPVAALDGFGYGDVPVEIRQSQAFADSSEISLKNTLLSLWEASRLISPDTLAPQTEALVQKAVSADLVSQADVDETQALSA